MYFGTSRTHTYHNQEWCHQCERAVSRPSADSVRRKQKVEYGGSFHISSTPHWNHQEILQTKLNLRRCQRRARAFLEAHFTHVPSYIREIVIESLSRIPPDVILQMKKRLIRRELVKRMMLIMLDRTMAAFAHNGLMVSANPKTFGRPSITIACVRRDKISCSDQRLRIQDRTCCVSTRITSNPESPPSPKLRMQSLLGLYLTSRKSSGNRSTRNESWRTVTLVKTFSEQQEAHIKQGQIRFRHTKLPLSRHCLETRYGSLPERWQIIQRYFQPNHKRRLKHNQANEYDFTFRAKPGRFSNNLRHRTEDSQPASQQPSSSLKTWLRSFKPLADNGDVFILTHESFSGIGIAQDFLLKRTIRQERHFSEHRATSLTNNEDCFVISINLVGISAKEQDYRLKLLKKLQQKEHYVKTVFERGMAWIISYRPDIHEHKNERGANAIMVSDNGARFQDTCANPPTFSCLITFPQLSATTKQHMPIETIWSNFNHKEPETKQQQQQQQKKKKQRLQRERRRRARQQERISKETVKVISASASPLLEQPLQIISGGSSEPLENIKDEGKSSSKASSRAQKATNVATPAMSSGSEMMRCSVCKNLPLSHPFLEAYVDKSQNICILCKWRAEDFRTILKSSIWDIRCETCSARFSQNDWCYSQCRRCAPVLQAKVGENGQQDRAEIGAAGDYDASRGVLDWKTNPDLLSKILSTD